MRKVHALDDPSGQPKKPNAELEATGGCIHLNEAAATQGRQQAARAALVNTQLSSDIAHASTLRCVGEQIENGERAAY